MCEHTFLVVLSQVGWFSSREMYSCSNYSSSRSFLGPATIHFLEADGFSGSPTEPSDILVWTFMDVNRNLS